MKKILALCLTLLMLTMSLAACGGSDGDLALVEERGKLIVGITDFAPMDYKDADSNWIGFDAELATKFAEYLGVEVEFFVIADWGKKALELEDQNIDCVWNGMTLTDDVKAAMATSNAYCNNAQVVVVPADKAAQYNTLESIANLNFAVEGGSAGEELIDALGYNKTVVAKQANALMEVNSGTSDACVIDLLMAASMTGAGTDYANLTYTVKLNDGEQYGVGFRKDSNLVEKINEFFKEAYADGTMQALAEKYRIQDSVIPQE